MLKKIFSYFFVIVLTTSILIPVCISVFELTNEISLAIDLEEDFEEDIELIKDIEFKIIPSINTFHYFLKVADKNEIVFIAKKHNPIFYKVDSPPPDFCS